MNVYFVITVSNLYNWFTIMMLWNTVVKDHGLTSNNRIGILDGLLRFNLLTVLIFFNLFLNNWKLLNQLSIYIPLTAFLSVKTLLSVRNIPLLVTDKIVHSVPHELALRHIALFVVRALVPFQIVKIATFFSVGVMRTTFLLTTWMLRLSCSIVITSDTHGATRTWNTS